MSLAANSRYKTILLPIVILVVTVVSFYLITNNPPTAKRGRPSMAPQINVEVQTLAKVDYPMVIDSYGTIKPRTQSILFPQVSGQIMAVSRNFQAGAFFDKGDVLIELDDRDLKAEVKIAQANLYSAKQSLIEEKARVEQAKQDWQRLGSEQNAPDLVLRKPQLLAAQATLYSAQATLEKADLALERSKIKAPFTGRILTKEVDLGQLVSPSTRLAEIYAVDYVEIRLPLKNTDLRFIDLPENSRLSNTSSTPLPDVTIYSELAEDQTWQGKVVRTEGAYDKNSQQLYVVAQIDDPYKNIPRSGLPLKIGQYVKAQISGRTAEQVIVIPNSTIYQGTYVYVVEKGILKRINVNIAWQNNDVAVIESGLSQGQFLVLTPLGQVTSGTSVRINMVDGVPVKRAKPTAKRPNKPAMQEKNSQQPSKENTDNNKGEQL
ncbi:efflux RND transporter periplasmic adaptor subunit [Thalassotalea sp. G2M2-11]|uniref:efflux RND transporter periplasmic adaptor subunit n=1 Tax=Thalassotalea sp. G2M2-11 TaxID=2787627 RepID=UPI0019D07102|nr:efflux RND transporter periplasmic adaptor subunit [Thalassotalea sp. G2M2-11]